MPCADLTGPPESDLSVTPGESHRLSPKANLRLARGPGCTLHILGEIEDLQSAEHYPVVKVRPLGLDRSLAGPASSDPLVGGSLSHGSEERCRLRHKTTARSRRAAVSTALALELVGASRPAIQFLSGATEAAACPPVLPGGGDEETRTPDPLLAKEMLCQLSYVPRRQWEVVGDTGLEPVTSALSGQRSNQLS